MMDEELKILNGTLKKIAMELEDLNENVKALREDITKKIEPADWKVKKEEAMIDKKIQERWYKNGGW